VTHGWAGTGKRSDTLSHAYGEGCHRLLHDGWYGQDCNLRMRFLRRAFFPRLQD